MSLEAGGPPAPPRRPTFVMTGKLEVVTEQDTPHEGRHLHGDWNSEALVQAGLPRTVMYSHYLLPGRPDTNVRTAGVLPPSGAYAGHLIMSGLDGLSATPEVMTLIFTSVGPERCIVEGRGSNCIGAFVMTGAGALVSSSEHKLEWKIKLTLNVGLPARGQDMGVRRKRRRRADVHERRACVCVRNRQTRP